MKKTIILLALILSGVLVFGSVSKATGTVDAVVNGETIQTGETSESTEDDSSSSWSSAYDFTAGSVQPPVTMEQAEAKVREKGGEVLSLTQTAAAYIVAIAFVVGIVCVAVGVFGKKDNAKGLGFGILITCAVAYTLVFIGPWLLDWIRAWAIS